MTDVEAAVITEMRKFLTFFNEEVARAQAGEYGTVGMDVVVNYAVQRYFGEVNPSGR